MQPTGGERRAGSRQRSGGAPPGGESVGLVGELARELAEQYRQDLKFGAEMGPLADLVDAAKGPTQRLSADIKGLASATATLLTSAPPVGPGQLGATVDEDTPGAPPPPAPRTIFDTIAEKRAKVEAMRRGGSIPPPAAAAAAPAPPQPPPPPPPPPPPQAARVMGLPVESGLPFEALEVVEVVDDGAVAFEVEAVVVEADEAVGAPEAYVTAVEVVTGEVVGATDVFTADDVFTGDVYTGNEPQRMRSPSGVTSVYDAAIADADFDLVVPADAAGSAAGSGIDDAVNIDVAVTSEERDEEEAAAERNKVLLDVVLLTAEASLGTLATRVSELLTPEEAREWTVLKAFRGQGDPKEQKVARAKEKLLDEMASGIKRG